MHLVCKPIALVWLAFTVRLGSKPGDDGQDVTIGLIQAGQGSMTLLPSSSVRIVLSVSAAHRQAVRRFGADHRLVALPRMLWRKPGGIRLARELVPEWLRQVPAGQCWHSEV